MCVSGWRRESEGGGREGGGAVSWALLIDTRGRLRQGLGKLAKGCTGKARAVLWGRPIGLFLSSPD